MRGKEYDEIMRLSARNTNMFGFPSVSILSKYVADIPQLSARGILTGTATRVLGGNQGVQPYKYGTKELDRQNGLDWYDSQARMYDPLLGRTPTMNPLSEKYYSISPYAWCAGNPVRLVDPTGQFYTDNIKDDTIYPLIAFFPSERDDA